MTEQARDAASAVKDALVRLDGLEEQFKTMKGIPPPANENQSGTQQVTQVTNSGDRTATWVLLAATALVLGINLGQRDTIAQQSTQIVLMQAQMNDVKAQVRRVEDYQNTTYQLVPKLREEVQKIIDSRKENDLGDRGHNR
jgi:ATP-dependent 26S proteasome regulatory subunit